ncbi:MAG: glycosyltransferase [Holdemanella sp.]|uniref:glycosyltransferase n=1 Tax=Holdemanella sp. TaxID=1971762 RepID=UPI002E781819|nr:glycosyltransferase [Holdemanella sp.]MEE0079813.1 glycosyltransferase [Holdemanella sp.]
MKVLQINSVCGKGSTGRIAVQISDYLNQHDVENYIAYGFGKSDRPNTFCFGNSLDAHLHSFMSRKLGWQGKMSHIPTWHLIQYMERINPDIVHLHNIHGHYLNYKMLFQYLKKKNCQVVWTFHDCWPVTGKCAHFTEVKCEKWKTGCFECPQLDRYPDSERDRSRKSYLEKKVAFTSIPNLHIVTVSNWLKSVAEASFLSNADIRCIYNGVDTERFSFHKSSIREQYQLQGKFILLSVASVWNKGKGLDQFIALSKKLQEDEIIVLIGVTPDQQKCLPENVIGIPAVSDQTVLAQWYSVADVYINFSIEETFGLVVAESIACGTPAIVMNSTACPEVVDADTGFVVEPLDIDAVQDTIEMIKTKGKETYSPKCKERIQQLFSLELMQRSYYELYKKLGGE